MNWLCSNMFNKISPDAEWFHVNHTKLIAPKLPIMLKVHAWQKCSSLKLFVLFLIDYQQLLLDI